ncbi:hypothetical protein DPMN_074212 [Dreissena polymorpha]|uniref:Uncharacterized protein n=1 Tax=Dreissena polymorpha TaxID=45954 RepID=A0A9D4BLF7_DREPO|nr:hypothetical protein DPMN_074212 [Dreissena polymorpha]
MNCDKSTGFSGDLQVAAQSAGETVASTPRGTQMDAGLRKTPGLTPVSMTPSSHMKFVGSPYKNRVSRDSLRHLTRIFIMN